MKCLAIFVNFSKLCKIQGDPGPRPIGPILKPFPDQGVFATQWNRVTESFWRGHTEFEWIGRRFLYHCRGMFWACADDYRMPPSEAEREFGSFTGVPGVKVRYFCWELGTEMQRELRMLSACSRDDTAGARRRTRADPVALPTSGR